VSLVVRPSSPELAPFVRSLGYYAGELPHARERVLPSGEMSLLVNLYEDEFRTYEGPESEVVRRLQRVLRAVGGSSEASWAEVAAEQGYYDQSHLIHDFRELTGITPTAYRPRSARERNHVPLTPAA
jgi:AraC-like DNA-binding protein